MHKHKCIYVNLSNDQKSYTNGEYGFLNYRLRQTISAITEYLITISRCLTKAERDIAVYCI